jgi:hypothetical protein
MKFRKVNCLFLLIISLYSMSTSVYADDVKFINQSKYNLFLSDDNPVSPTRFFEAGTTITIDEVSFREICKGHADQCKFYMFKKYSENVATVTFRETNIVSINNKMSRVSVLGYSSNVIVKNN